MNKVHCYSSTDSLFQKLLTNQGISNRSYTKGERLLIQCAQKVKKPRYPRGPKEAKQSKKFHEMSKKRNTV